MKRLFSFLILALALCTTMTLQSADYLMLTPLDTAALPNIPDKKI